MLFIKEKDFEKLLEENNIRYKENSSIFGIVRDTSNPYWYNGLMAQQGKQFFLVNFGHEGLAIYRVKGSTKLKKEDLDYFKYDEIGDIFFDKIPIWPSWDLKIDIYSKPLELNVDKWVLGYGWHGKNLKNVMADLGHK